MGSGIDPTQVAKNLITWLGGPSGGYLVAAAVLIALLLSMGHLCERGKVVWTLVFASLAWGLAFLMNQLLGISA
jgi:hypothetical protein